MRRGDVVELRLPMGTGHEQHGRRYGVIVQNDALLPRSVVLVALTSEELWGIDAALATVLDLG